MSVYSHQSDSSSLRFASSPAFVTVYVCFPCLFVGNTVCLPGYVAVLHHGFICVYSMTKEAEYLLKSLLAFFHNILFEVPGQVFCLN